MSVTALRPSHPIPLDDEIAALAFQLEELGLQSESSKGKHPIDRPSNFEVVFAAFQAELEEYQAFLADKKLAQSIGAAVHSDGAVIGDLTAQEIQSHEDHRFVLQLSNDDPEIEAPPGTVDHHVQGNVDDWMSTVAETVAAYSVVDFSDDETEAGPSMTYAERQADTIKKMSMEFQCVACTDRYARTSMVTTKCGHRYCAGCAKSLFMRSTKDEGLFPPKCCKQPIPLPLVAKHMDVDELAVFELASVEFATQHRIYCSNLDCSMFIVPNNVDASQQRATCSACGTETCSLCSNGYHGGRDCPDDPSIRETRELARSLGWQTCQACNRLVQLRSGCNHMTCLCSAEFCYVCGTNWKNCNCAAADIDRIEERAEEIVERDAPPDIPPQQRLERFRQVFAELQDNHECEHSRHFRRISWDRPRRGFRCEMCDARHYKYILQCRHCYVNVCEECRRNRI
ncbi:hypothetical protein HBH46_153890 [Parastagonospora nodorum]|nr:hypothetical protein HBH46_153890 [Parastagonospora nodorum]